VPVLDRSGGDHGFIMAQGTDGLGGDMLIEGGSQCCRVEVTVAAELAAGFDHAGSPALVPSKPRIRRPGVRGRRICSMTAGTYRGRVTGPGAVPGREPSGAAGSAGPSVIGGASHGSGFVRIVLIGEPGRRRAAVNGAPRVARVR